MMTLSICGIFVLVYISIFMIMSRSYRKIVQMKKCYTRKRLEYSQKIKEAKMKESYFDGGILDYIGYSILVAIIFRLTLGIATSWAVCMMQN